MQATNAIVISLLALILLTACGTGSTGGPAAVAPLNKFEDALVGRYSLADFKLYAEGDQIYWPEHFGAAYGVLELLADRKGRIDLGLTECQNGPDRTCDRQFTWRADAGLLEISCSEEAGTNGIAEWDTPTRNMLRLRFFVPTNRPDCSLPLVENGYEILDWVVAQ